MVLRFTDHVEYQVPLKDAATAHAVVHVEACSWAVETYIVLHQRAHSLRLEIAADLLLEVAYLVDEIRLDAVSQRVVTVTSVAALALGNWHGAVGAGKVCRIPPRHYGILAHPLKFVADYGGVARVAADHHAVAIDALKSAVRDRDALHTCQVHRSPPRYRPISAAVRGQAMWR